MNPYLAVSLAMCVIVVLSLAATGYLAAVFNRRAKADLAARLEPLAAAVGGEADLDEAQVRGRRGGHLVFGRVATGQGGIGRLFHVEVVDSAGGERWEWSSLPVKGAAAPARAFEGGAELERRLGVDWVTLSAAVPGAATDRYGFLYDPEAGMLRLTRAMHTRLDIPDPPTFLAQLDALIGIGPANRRAQGAPDADLGERPGGDVISVASAGGAPTGG